jgi:hypothetical protein
MTLRNLESKYPKRGSMRIERDDLRVPNPPPSADSARHDCSRAIEEHLANHRALVDQAAAPTGNIDKTLSGIKGMPAGPEKTPGGHGQVWRKL